MYACIINDSFKLKDVIYVSENIDDNYFKLMITTLVRPDEHENYLKNIYQNFIVPDTLINNIKIYEADIENLQPFMTYTSYTKVIKAVVYSEYDDSKRFKCVITIIGNNIDN